MGVHRSRVCHNPVCALNQHCRHGMQPMRVALSTEQQSYLYRRSLMMYELYVKGASIDEIAARIRNELPFARIRAEIMSVAKVIRGGVENIERRRREESVSHGA